MFGQIVQQKQNAIGAGLGVTLLAAAQNDSPRDGFTQVMISEYEKGVRDGMLAVLNLPRNTIEYAEGEIPLLRDRIVELSPSEDAEGGE